MKITNSNYTRLNKISFTGKIIDAHAHIGKWQGANYNPETLDSFIKQPLKNGDTIEKMLVSSLSCIEQNGMKDELEGNIEMLNIAQNNSKIVPLAVCQPKTGSVKNIKKLINENPNKFVGLKFHPDGHEIMANDSRVIPYLKFAEEKNLPCLFHCGIAWDGAKLVSKEKQFSHPDKIYEAAKSIPSTPVILAHLGAGGEQVHPSAIKVLLDSIEKGDAKLYTDISWVDIADEKKPTIINLINALKKTSKGDMTKRILFGSDAPIGEFATGKKGLSGTQFYEKTVIDIKNAIKDNFGDEADELIDKIFYKNANELFFKSNTKPTIIETAESVTTKSSSLKKFLPLVIGGIAITAAIIYKFLPKTKPIETLQKVQIPSIGIEQFISNCSKK